MSFIVAIKGPQGIALASESRSISYEHGQEYWTSDGFTKLFALPPPHRWVGLLLAGEWPKVLGPSSGLIAELASKLPDRRLSVAEYAERLGGLLAELRAVLPFAPTVIVAGYDESGGHVFHVGDPRAGRAARGRGRHHVRRDA